MKPDINRKIAPKAKSLDGSQFSVHSSQFSLENGIPVYIISSGVQDLVKIEFFFNAGNWQQPSSLVAKFTAEMLAEGTKARTAEEIADIFDYYSAYIDKDCDRDKATIAVTCLNKHLKNILPVFFEIIAEPVFPENEVSTFIQNKKQQFILNNEKVSFIAKHKFKEIIYGNDHPYGKNFTIHDFDSINSHKLADFHKNYYTSSNCWIMVSGKPDKNIISELNKYFGNNWNNTPTPNHQSSYLIPHTSDLKHFINKKNALQCAVRIGKVMFNYNHPDYFRFKILNTVLGGYFGSRLMSNIREDKGFTYGIGSTLISLHNSGYFFITSQIGTEFCKEAISEIFREMKRLQDVKVPAKELDLVRNYMLGNFLRSIDGPFAQADINRILIEYKLDKDYFYKYIDKIQTINSQEIMETAQEYLQPDSMHEIIVGKK